MVAIFLLNVMEVFSLGRCALLDRPGMVFEGNETNKKLDVRSDISFFRSLEHCRFVDSSAILSQI